MVCPTLQCLNLLNVLMWLERKQWVTPLWQAWHCQVLSHCEKHIKHTAMIFKTGTNVHLCSYNQCCFLKYSQLLTSWCIHLATETSHTLEFFVLNFEFWELLIELRFYSPLNTKWVISELLYPANLLASTEKTKIKTRRNNHRNIQ